MSKKKKRRATETPLRQQVAQQLGLQMGVDLTRLFPMDSSLMVKVITKAASKPGHHYPNLEERVKYIVAHLFAISNTLIGTWWRQRYKGGPLLPPSFEAVQPCLSLYIWPVELTTLVLEYFTLPNNVIVMTEPIVEAIVSKCVAMDSTPHRVPDQVASIQKLLIAEDWRLVGQVKFGPNTDLLSTPPAIPQPQLW